MPRRLRLHSAAWRIVLALALGAGLAVTARHWQPARIPASPVTELGTFGGTQSIAYGVTDDGVVVGQANLTGDSAAHAFFWTQAGGMVDLGTLGGTNSYAYGVSADGHGSSANRRSPATAPTSLPLDAGGRHGRSRHPRRHIAPMPIASPPTAAWSSAIAHLTGGNGNAFLWTQAGGMVDLGTLGGTNSAA